MTNKKEIFAGIIIIGNEILSGRTQDTNTSTLSIWLNSLGIKVQEVRTIPDIEKTIISTVNELRKKYDYIFTSGGIGPTHDDITSKSISKAFKLKYEFHKEAYNILEKYYGPEKFSEGRKKMAKMPKSSSLIYNPSSGAPGFIVDNVYCLPGVPSILKSMVYGLKDKIVGLALAALIALVGWNLKETWTMKEEVFKLQQGQVILSKQLKQVKNTVKSFKKKDKKKKKKKDDK